jgi:Fe-S cluster assembly protein SufB
MAAVKQTVEHVASLEKYKHGFVSDIEQDFAPKGLNADIVRFISAKKDEPQWMLDWRLDAFERWLAMDEPDWAKVNYPRIDYQDSYYYAAPKEKVGPKSLDEVDPESWRPTRSWASRCASRRCWRASRARRAMPWTRCSTACRVVTTFKKELGRSG